MRYGIWVPNFGEYAEIPKLVVLAREAEAAGWDGFFVWDHVLRTETVPIADPWVALAAVAVETERVRIGPLVTPVPRRRASKLAREVVSLDHLSAGRVVLGVGLGSPPEPEFARFGEDADLRVRAAKLDEGLEVLAGLWTGERFDYEGRYHRVRDAVFLPRPIQLPRVPIWVGAFWPKKPSFRRAARWDGVFPLKHRAERITPGDVKEIARFTGSLGARAGSFEIVVTGATPKGDSEATSRVAALRDAGATWWLEWCGWEGGGFEVMLARARRGPPGSG